MQDGSEEGSAGSVSRMDSHIEEESLSETTSQSTVLPLTLTVSLTKEDEGTSFKHVL